MNKDYISWLRHSSPYINAHRGKTFVLMLPGAAIEQENFKNIIYDIALLRSLHVKLVVVFGMRPQIDSRFKEAGIKSSFVINRRVTERKDLKVILQVAGEECFKIKAALSVGLPNSPLHGSKIRVLTGNFVLAKPLGVIDGVDFHFSGLVRKIDSMAIEMALDSGAIVIIPPIGVSPSGEVFNLSFADVAREVALAIKTDKFISFTSSDGILNADGNLIRQLEINECDKLIKDFEKENTTSQSLTTCYSVCKEGVKRSQIVSYVRDGALLEELFTREGSGTLVYTDDYEIVKQGSVDDIPGILRIVKPLERKGVLVERSVERLEREIDSFVVIKKEGVVIACGALYKLSENTGEFGCLAVHDEYSGLGLAVKILQEVEKKALSVGISELFVLTTQASHWFIENGFIEVEIKDLPKNKKDKYDYSRKSKVFIKKIQS